MDTNRAKALNAYMTAVFSGLASLGYSPEEIRVAMEEAAKSEVAFATAKLVASFSKEAGAQPPIPPEDN